MTHPQEPPGKEVGSRTSFFLELARGEGGADATEYALVISMVAIAIIGSVFVFGTTLADAIRTIRSSLPTFAVNTSA